MNKELDIVHKTNQENLAFVPFTEAVLHKLSEA